MSNSVKALFQCIKAFGGRNRLKINPVKIKWLWTLWIHGVSISSLKWSSSSPDGTDIQFEGLLGFLVPVQRGVSN